MGQCYPAVLLQTFFADWLLFLSCPSCHRARTTLCLGGMQHYHHPLHNEFEIVARDRSACRPSMLKTSLAQHTARIWIKKFPIKNSRGSIAHFLIVNSLELKTLNSMKIRNPMLENMLSKKHKNLVFKKLQVTHQAFNAISCVQ